MIPVQSSNLAAVEYELWRRVLYIKFRGGRLYAYSGVPAFVYHGLLRAESHGKYFWAHIRDKFPCTRLV